MNVKIPFSYCHKTQTIVIMSLPCPSAWERPPYSININKANVNGVPLTFALVNVVICK